MADLSEDYSWLAQWEGPPIVQQSSTPTAEKATCNDTDTPTTPTDLVGWKRLLRTLTGATYTEKGSHRTAHSVVTSSGSPHPIYIPNPQDQQLASASNAFRLTILEWTLGMQRKKLCTRFPLIAR
jgi:hypothetical protein